MEIFVLQHQVDTLYSAFMVLGVIFLLFAIISYLYREKPIASLLLVIANIMFVVKCSVQMYFGTLDTLIICEFVIAVLALMFGMLSFISDIVSIFSDIASIEKELQENQEEMEKIGKNLKELMAVESSK